MTVFIGLAVIVVRHLSGHSGLISSRIANTINPLDRD